MDGIAHVSWITGEVCEASVVQDAIKTKVLDMSFAVKSEGAFIAEKSIIYMAAVTEFNNHSTAVAAETETENSLTSTVSGGVGSAGSSHSDTTTIPAQVLIWFPTRIFCQNVCYQLKIKEIVECSGDSYRLNNVL